MDGARRACYTDAVRAAFLASLLVLPASAQEVEKEDYKIIGWNDACGVAVERYAYPRFGQAIYGEPITTRVGTIAIVSATPVVQTNWMLEADGPNTYDRAAIERIRKQLKKIGFEKPGFPERIRLDAKTSDKPGTSDIIFSTATLEARPAEWPSSEWRWRAAHYNPLTTCALMIFERPGERFKFVLTRIYNPSSRSDRARAHTTNGRNLFDEGDLEGALAEAKTGAELAPELAATRYHHAAMLALSGRDEEAMSELRAAVSRDSRFAAKAADDLDFDSLRVRQDFRRLVEGLPRKAPLK